MRVRDWLMSEKETGMSKKPQGKPLVEVLAPPVQYAKPGLPVLFAVWGTCGAGRFPSDWVIALYEDEAQAFEHQRLATEHFNALKRQYKRNYNVGFPYDVPMEERLRFDHNELGMQDDTEYYVSIMFVHQKPTAFQQELAVATDKAREHGIWGNPYPDRPNAAHSYLGPTTRRQS